MPRKRSQPSPSSAATAASISSVIQPPSSFLHSALYSQDPSTATPVIDLPTDMPSADNTWSSFFRSVQHPEDVPLALNDLLLMQQSGAHHGPMPLTASSDEDPTLKTGLTGSLDPMISAEPLDMQFWPMNGSTSSATVAGTASTSTSPLAQKDGHVLLGECSDAFMSQAPAWNASLDGDMQSWLETVSHLDRKRKRGTHGVVTPAMDVVQDPNMTMMLNAMQLPSLASSIVESRGGVMPGVKRPRQDSVDSLSVWLSKQHHPSKPMPKNVHVPEMIPMGHINPSALMGWQIEQDQRGAAMRRSKSIPTTTLGSTHQDDSDADGDDDDVPSRPGTANAASRNGNERKRRQSTGQSNHNVIERRYRTNLNARIAELRSVIPAFTPRGSAPGDTSVSGETSSSSDEGDSAPGECRSRNTAAGSALQRPSRAVKQNKGTVLQKAVEHIQYVSRRCDRRGQELKLLRAYIKSLAMAGGGTGDEAEDILQAAGREARRRTSERWERRERVRQAQLQAELSGQAQDGKKVHTPPPETASMQPSDPGFFAPSSMLSSPEQHEAMLTPTTTGMSMSPRSTASVGARSMAARLAMAGFMCVAAFYTPTGGDDGDTRGLAAFPGAAFIFGSSSGISSTATVASAWRFLRIFGFLLCLMYFVTEWSPFKGDASKAKGSIQTSEEEDASMYVIPTQRQQRRRKTKSRSSAERRSRHRHRHPSSQHRGGDLEYTGYSCTSMIAACWDLAVSTMFHMTGPRTPHLLRHAFQLLRPTAIPTDNLLDVIVRLDAGDRDDDATRARVLLRAAVVLRLAIPIKRVALWAAKVCWDGAVYAAEYAGHDPALWPLRDPEARQHLSALTWISRDGIRLRAVVGGDPWPMANALLARAARIELNDRIHSAWKQLLLPRKEPMTRQDIMDIVRDMNGVADTVKTVMEDGRDVELNAITVSAIAAYQSGLHERFTQGLKRILELSWNYESPIIMAMTSVALASVPEAHVSAAESTEKGIRALQNCPIASFNGGLMEWFATCNLLLDVCVELEDEVLVVHVPLLVDIIRQGLATLNSERDEMGALRAYEVPLCMLLKRLVFIGGADQSEGMDASGWCMPGWEWTRQISLQG